MNWQSLPPLLFLLVATLLEVSGDAIVRVAIFHRAGVPRVGLFLAGATLLFGYGTFLNLAPLESSEKSSDFISPPYLSYGSF